MYTLSELIIVDLPSLETVYLGKKSFQGFYQGYAHYNLIRTFRCIVNSRPSSIEITDIGFEIPS